MSDLSLEYLDRILEVNKHINLTHITDRDSAQILHLEDSLAVLPEMNSAPEGLYADIGSGGGFPGVPLALKTNRETYLIDSVSKKMKAVQTILDEMDISNHIHTIGSRIEEVSLEMPGAFSVMTARALSGLSSLIELASPLLRIDGHLICLKARIEEDEITAADRISDKTGMKLISKRNYLLSDNETYREVLVYEKFAEPTLYLPRRVGLAQKRPLK